MIEKTYEDGFIAGLLSNPKKIADVRDWVAPKDILDNLIKQVYISMLDLDYKGLPVNVSTISEVTQPLLPENNITQDLYSFLENLKIGGFDPVYYGRKVVELSKRRDLKSLALNLSMQNENNKPLEEIFEYALKEVNTLYRGVQLQVGKELHELMFELAQAKDAELSGGKPPRIPTHFTALDAILSGGFKYGSVVTIAAASGVGKSTFGMNILRNAAVNSLIPVMLITLEMTEEEVAIGTVSSLAKINNEMFASEKKEEIERVMKLSAAIGVDLRREGVKFNVWSNSSDKFGLAITAIRRHIQSEPNCKMVMIDYIGLLSSPGHALKTYEIGFMMQTIKQLALELNIVILVLAQTNRSSGNNKPMPEFTLDALGHSASLGDTANIVMFIDSKEGSDVAQIIVKKHRGGKKGVATLKFQKDKCLFTDMREQFYDN